MAQEMPAFSEPLSKSSLQHQPTVAGVLSLGTREVIRCCLCLLVQYRTVSGFCRRCDQPLPRPQEAETAAQSPEEQRQITEPPAAEAGSNAVEWRGKTLPGFSLGQRLRELRESKNLTQAQVARKAHVPRTYISRIEHGHLLPGLGVVQRLAEALGLEVLDLLPRQGQHGSSADSSADPYWNALSRHFRCLRHDQQAAVLARVRAMQHHTQFSSVA